MILDSGEGLLTFAHQMGNIEGDFEKGEDDGSRDALHVIATAAKVWLSHETDKKVE